MCNCIDTIRKSAVSTAGKETAEPERWVDELNEQTHLTNEHNSTKNSLLHTSTVAQLVKNVITTSRIAAPHTAMVTILGQTNATYHTIAFFGGPFS
jgi:hypothetical protein